MQNYFDNEIAWLEKEVRWLKTSAVKSGTTITSAVKSVNYSISLTLSSPTNANGQQTFLVETSDSALFNASLDIYFDDVAKAKGDTRRRVIEQYYLSDNKYIVNVLAWGDSSDRSTLSGGGAVTIAGRLTVTCTSDFTLEAI